MAVGRFPDPGKTYQTRAMADDSMMKAVVFDQYGSPARLSLCHIPIPQPAADEVRMRVLATTVNRTDTATLREHPFFARAVTGLLRPKMRKLGMDFAGVVDALADSVTAFEPGDRVFGLLPDWFGAHAEYICTPADAAVARIPGDLAFDVAVVGEGARFASASTGLLHEGQRCLIYGASGAIGTAAVQLAKVQGAEVTAAVGSRHLEIAARLGADHVVNYEKEDFTAIGKSFDLVLDAVGKTSWLACRPLLKTGGIFAATDLGPDWTLPAASEAGLSPRIPRAATGKGALPPWTPGIFPNRRWSCGRWRMAFRLGGRWPHLVSTPSARPCQRVNKD